MPKITEFAEDTSIGGAELMYVVDGSTDKHAVLTSLKSLFNSTVVNLAALKAYEGLADNQAIWLIGGSADNDDKAGCFYWDATSLAAADDQDVVQVTDVVTGRWLRALDQTYVNTTGDTITGVIDFQAVPTGSTLPPGCTQMYAGSTTPSGWLFCRGDNVSRTTYAELFAVIGTVFGNGDGTTTFTLPDLRGRSPIGRGTGDADYATNWGLAEKGGAEKIELSEGEMPIHNHSVTNVVVAGSADPSWGLDGNTARYKSADTGNAGSGQAHSNIHPVLGLNFIIKT